MAKPAAPSLAVIQTGTDTPDTAGAARLLRAGPLQIELADGNLRYIKVAGVEVLRALAFLVRDENWGTYTPRIVNFSCTEDPDGFAVEYDAHCVRGGQSLVYHARIAGKADGSLAFDARVRATTDFLTARTGFVVLHPLEGIVGRTVEVEHVDGRRVTSTFPRRIDPVQPFLDVRSLSHQVAPGVWAAVRMEGDTFEMEDHRNWTDASFKTYVRPLARPWPYVLEAGSEGNQRVTVTLSGLMGSMTQRAEGGPVEVTLGTTDGRMPAIGVGIPAEEASATLHAAHQFGAVGPQGLVLQFDPRQGHGVALLRTYRALVEAVGGDAVLEIVLPAVAPPEVELAAVARAVHQAGLKLAAVAVSPAPDLKSVLPGTPFPPCPTFEAIYAAARRAFPDVGLGGGMFSFFTELNRKRPPAELLDYLTHTTCPIVHAADDRSVMETLEALPYVIESARALAKGKGYRVGPSSIGPRDNPHGASTADNPDNGRVCLAKVDPRQRGLFGAAWMLGYVAAFARGGAEMVTLGSATGPAGLIHRKLAHAQPWYDQQRGTTVYPAFHVVAGMARAAGSERVEAKSSRPRAVEALAHKVEGGTRVWLANLTASAQAVQLHQAGRARVRMLDDSNFVEAARNQVAFAAGAGDVDLGRPLELRPYAVACIELSR